MRNHKFWDGSTDSPLRLATRTFVENNELTCGLTDEAQYQYEDELMSFIESVKDLVAEETEKEYFREDVQSEMAERYGDYGETLFKLLPITRLDKLIDVWQDRLSDNSLRSEIRDDTLDECLKEQSWTGSFDEYEETDVHLYFVYLKDWFSSHQEGDPVGIDEFLACEMRDDEIAPYYWNLLKEQENPNRLTREQKEQVRQVIDKAEKSGVPMGDKALMLALMELATVHYELELDVMLNNSDFDFLHDFMQIPSHFDKKTGTFDDRFLPRFSKRSLN